MRCCWRSCGPQVCWTWTTPRSTARTSERSKGGSHRTFAGRPGSARQQAPLDRRPAWHTAGRLADQRKSARCHAADAPARRDTPHSGRSRPATSPTRPAVRRPRLRLRQVPSASPGSRHHTEVRTERHHTRLRAGKDPLGRGADLRLASPVQATPDPLRDTRRPPPRTASTRLQHHLLETTTNLILKRSVSERPADSANPSWLSPAVRRYFRMLSANPVDISAHLTTSVCPCSSSARPIRQAEPKRHQPPHPPPWHG